MPNFEIKRGDIFFLNFDPAQGFEIKGVRPAVVIQNNSGNQYSRTIIVAAMTKNPKKPRPIFVRVLASESGLPSDSTVLLDQIYTITKERFRNPPVGRLTKTKLQEVDEAIKNSLGL